LCSEQRVDGSWAGETTGEITTLSQLVLLFGFLNREQEELATQAARAILRQQLSDGGWAIAAGGAFDLDASVLAYFALKLVGEDACGQAMAAARRAIRARGGADRCCESTRRWLALLGQIDYELCEPVMPEWLLASSLSSEATSQDLLELATRSVVWSKRPRREIEVSRGVRELFVESPRSWAPAERSTRHVAARFGRFWSRCERAGLVPFRRRALERASFLLREASAEGPALELRFEELAWQRIALAALGLRDAGRAVRECERRLLALIAVDELADEARSQPATTLTADTSLALAALASSGVTRAEAAAAAGLHWILQHRLPVQHWSAKVAEMTFLLRALTEFDADDVVDCESLPPSLRVRDDFTGIDAVSNAEELVPAESLQPFVDQLVSRLSVEQLPHGGWAGEGAAAQRASGINHASGRRFDARTAELTGEVLECVTAGGICVRAVCERAVISLRTAQLGDGRWDSATHARFIYGTSCAVRGMIAAGVSADDPAVAQGVNWLLVHQAEAGGWGEACGNTSAGQEFVPADATSIQTAWAVLALVAAGMADHDAVRRGVNFLVESQLEHGGWCDKALVERDSSHGPWYQNQLHATSWSLLALAAWAKSITGKVDSPAAQLRLVCDDSTR